MAQMTMPAPSRTADRGRDDALETVLGRRIRDRLLAAAELAEATGVHVELEVTPRGHGALVTITLNGRQSFGPVAPELAEAFLRGVAFGAGGR